MPNFEYDYISCLEEGQLLPLIKLRENKFDLEAAAELRKKVEQFNEAARKTRGGYPDLSVDQFIVPEINYPAYQYAPSDDKGVIVVPLNEITGESWVNIPKYLRTCGASYAQLARLPKGKKLVKALEYLVGLKNEEYEPIQLEQIDQVFFIKDGHHRLYAARLLGLKEIKAQVIQYDYNRLLPRLTLISSKRRTRLKIQVDSEQIMLEIPPQAVAVLREKYKISEKPLEMK